jgi:hypothetical protein
MDIDMKEEDFVTGAIVGRVGVAVLLVSQREQEQEQKHPMAVTKSLIPFTWASLDPTEPFIAHETHQPMELQLQLHLYAVGA